MLMGLGCNAAAIVGCRIIDSPRERLIAILTNAFVPCNGRFPALIAVISMFFTYSAFASGALAGAVMLTALLIVSVAATLLCGRLLSRTLLKGEQSSFTLELPPFRMPRVGRLIVRSVVDRTLFVLGRAAAVAAPAGLLLYALSNISIGGQSILAAAVDFLDPFARVFGLDGAILIAFMLGFPANEIVLPIAIMAYNASGSLEELPARREELDHAVEEGVTLHLLCNPVRILGYENPDDPRDPKNGSVRAMEVIRMELGEPDERGRRRPVEAPGSEFIWETDCVIMALGTSPNPLIKNTTEGLAVNRWGGIIADEDTGETSRPGVYAGGDAVTGAATVILAMGAGKKAAQAIDQALQKTP